MAGQADMWLQRAAKRVAASNQTLLGFFQACKKQSRQLVIKASTPSLLLLTLLLLLLLLLQQEQWCHCDPHGG
jgi:hypothetical protein